MTIQEMNEKKRELGYSYEQIAYMSGIPVSTVQKVLGGVTKAPRYETLKALEEVFKEHGMDLFSLNPDCGEDIPQGKSHYLIVFQK